MTPLLFQVIKLPVAVDSVLVASQFARALCSVARGVVDPVELGGGVFVTRPGVFAMRVFQVLRGLFRPAAPAGDDPFKRTIWGTVKRYKQELWIIGAMSAALSMSMRLVAQKHQHQAVVSDLQGAVDELQALSGRQRQALDTIEAAVESGTVNDVRAAIEVWSRVRM